MLTSAFVIAFSTKRAAKAFFAEYEARSGNSAADNLSGLSKSKGAYRWYVEGEWAECAANAHAECGYSASGSSPREVVSAELTSYEI